MEFYFLGKREQRRQQHKKIQLIRLYSSSWELNHRHMNNLERRDLTGNFTWTFFVVCYELLCFCVWIRLRYVGIIKSINAGRRGAWGESRKRQRHIFILTLQPSAETSTHKKWYSFFFSIRRWWSLASYNFSSLNFTLVVFCCSVSLSCGWVMNGCDQHKKNEIFCGCGSLPCELIMSLKNFTNEIFSLARANRVHKGNLLPLFFRDFTTRRQNGGCLN